MPSRLIVPIVALQRSVPPVHHTCCGDELFTMTCQGMCAVVDICHAVVDVEKVGALNFVSALRFSFALQIQLPAHVLCCKMSSIFRQQNAITALLDLCSASSKWHAYSL